MMVRVTATAWAALMKLRPDLAAEPLVRDWVTAGHPLIVRRGGDRAEAHLIPLGLPLPPSHGKRRIAITRARDDLTHIAPPPLLAEARAAAPVAWQPVIDRLLALSPAVRTFGSLAWQHLTGLSYLTPQSDLDLLWQLPAGRAIDDLAPAIAAIAATASMRLDGEIVGDAGAVNWRELLPGGDHQVLLKGMHEVRMTTRTAFLAGSIA